VGACGMGMIGKIKYFIKGVVNIKKLVAGIRHKNTHFYVLDEVPEYFLRLRAE
jgi:hypothetical protein